MPSLVFQHEEKRLLDPLSNTPFTTDDVEGSGVTKMFRVTFDRNKYSVPWRLVSQSVVVRANDTTVSVFLGTKQVAFHARSWGVGEDIEHPSHTQGLLEQKPRAAAGSLGRRALGVVKQNLVVALGVIITLVVADLLGWLNLPTGVIGHEGSTLLVTLNGLRLLARIPAVRIDPEGVSPTSPEVLLRRVAAASLGSVSPTALPRAKRAPPKSASEPTGINTMPAIRRPSLRLSRTGVGTGARAYGAGAKGTTAPGASGATGATGVATGGAGVAAKSATG